MARILAVLLLALVPSVLLAQDQVEIIPTHNTITVHYGVEALPSDASCLVTLTDSGDSPVDTSTQATGLSRREAIFAGLSASTEYLITIGCDGTIFDWVDDESITTSADPGAGDVTSTVQFGTPTHASVARATLEYDDNAALSSSTTTQNTSCASGCSIDMTAPGGLQYWRWIWQTAGDVTLATTPVVPLSIGVSTLRVAESVLPTVVPPIPELASWEANMLSFGADHCATFAGRSAAANFGDTYYDAIKVYRQIRIYTSDASWDACIEDVTDSYRDYYVLPNNGSLPGYWVFSNGMKLDFDVTASALSSEGVIDLSLRGAYCDPATPLSYTTNADKQREVGYCIMAHVDAELLGEDRSTYFMQAGDMNDLVDHALDHLDQLFVTKDFNASAGHLDDPSCSTGDYGYQPFMTGIAARALIAVWDLTADDRIQAALTTALDVMWVDAWVEADEAMWYQNCKAEPGDAWPAQDGAPDLNLLIAPAYQWLFERTADTGYRDKADALFAGGVGDGNYTGAGLYQSKVFNQNYLWSFQYVAWRQ